MKRVIAVIGIFFMMILTTGCEAGNVISLGDDIGKAVELKEEIVVGATENSPIGYSFKLPEGWAYEIYYEDDGTPNPDTLCIVMPDKEGITGGIKFGFMKRFLICGTGLRWEKISFNGYEASKSYYEETNNWVYISLKGPYKGGPVAQ